MADNGDEDDRGNQLAPTSPRAEEGEDPSLVVRSSISEVREEDAVISLSGTFESIAAEDVHLVEPREPSSSEVKTRLATPNHRTPASAPPEGPPKDPRLGQTLVGRYRVERLIGKGGMGRVYLATQHPLNRSVAVKILNPEFQKKDTQFVRRFFLEAATAARLNHPNTITIFDYGETDGGELFIAMEYLKGRALSRVIGKEGPFSAERCLHVSMQIVRALREAHSKGIIHRDLKPGNIMLLDEGDDENFSKVLDFGLVKLFTPEGDEENPVMEQLTPSPLDGELTRAGMFLGSPKYMSPEQIQGTHLDPRTDVYSLGIIMFQMLTGRVPFQGGNSVEIIYKHVHTPVPAIHDVNPEADAPPELEHIISRCLAKKRDERIASMSDLLLELKSVRRAIIGSGSSSGSLDGLGLDLDTFRRNVDSTSYPPMNPVSSVPPPGAVPQAPFVDRDTADTGAHPLVDISYAHRRFRRTPSQRLLAVFPYVAALGLILGLGFLAYKLASPKPAPSRATAPPPPPPPKAVAPKKAQLSFDSRPAGAQVFAGEALLGETPFERSLALEKDEARTFVFKKTGFLDVSIEHELSPGARAKIVATLPEAPAAAAPVKPSPPKVVKKPNKGTRKKRDRKKKTRSDYKDNPY